ncbi:MAG TPA: hypothetical protein VGT61_00420 [Thermomicrobiales bacterium]|jgi:hypothetical protein|nr:hypothetical protein [Thermomicrobiales bacterium]
MIAPVFNRFVRVGAVAALMLALVAALAGGPSAARAGVVPAGPITLQTWTCPDNYAGQDYLNDCTPGAAPNEASVTYPDGDTATNIAGGDGVIAFPAGVAGDHTVTLNESSASNTFYYACFDGADVFAFDGASNSFQVSLGAAESLFCRWYITPIVDVAPSPSPSGGDGIYGAGFAVRPLICPVEYAGDDFLDDCGPVNDVLVQINPGATYDESTAISGYSVAGEGVMFDNLEAGTYTVSLGVPGDFADFYFACFDTTSGSEVYLRDGDTNIATFDVADMSVTVCRWYIIPVDAGAPTTAPSASSSAAASNVPSVAPTVKPSAGGPVRLPSTGAGTDAGTAPTETIVAILALVAVIVAGLAGTSLARRSSTGQ